MNKITKQIQKTQSKELDKTEQQKSKEKQTRQISIFANQKKEMKLFPQKDKSNNRMMTELSTQRHRQIQSQKELVKMQLKQINQKIYQIKQQEQTHSLLYIRQQIANNIEAKKMAINLVKYHRQRKKQFQQKKRKFQQKLRSNIIKECQQQKIKRQALEQALRQQKRNVISMRMHESKLQRQKRQQIQNESNSLVKQLLKEDSKVHLKSKQKLIGDSRYQFKVVQRKPTIDFLQIQKHQSQYLLHKHEINKKQRSISISYPIKTYEKNRWAYKLQQVQMKQRQAQQLKKMQKQNLLQRKIKYGQLIHSIFVQKKIKTQKSQQKIYKSHSMGNEDIRKNSSYKAFLGKHNNLNKTQQTKEASPQHLVQEQLKKNRLLSLKKQTVKRLVNIQLFKAKRKIFEPSKYQSKYDNYLGKVNIKKKKQSSVWNQIMNNKKLTHQEKNISILQKAVALQNKAKFKQSLKSEQDKVVSLYLDSIQAKLVILKNM